MLSKAKVWEIIVVGLVSSALIVLGLGGCLKTSAPPKAKTTTTTTAYATLSQFDDLSNQVQALQKANAANSTVIGATPTSIDGLSVTFLISSAYISSGYAQLSVKISNTNTYSITNLDIVGALTLSSHPPNGSLVTIADGANAVVYNVSYDGAGIANFEIYSTNNGSVTPITIPAGGSITLRPKLGITPTLGATASINVTIAIATIAYDQGK